MDRLSAILERLLALHPREIDLSLGRLERLLARMNNPERRLPPVIHVAGTNGKGSTTAMMRAALEAEGHAVHVYTSPHLVNFRERIRIGRPGGGQLIGDDRLADTLLSVERINAGEEITFFEVTTAAAFQLFAQTPADFLLLEVGLGGRLDATNVVERPAASVISVISHDHEKFLGARLDVIAAEKAGILKPGVPGIIAPQRDLVTDVLEKTAARVGAPLQIGGRDWQVWEERGRLVFQDGTGLLDLPPPRLFGRHQFLNAGLAIAALREFAPRLAIASLEAGLRDADWPARMQRLSAGALVDGLAPGIELWLDGGHNPGAGTAIAETLADLEEKSPRPLTLITGMLTTKDPVGYFRPFAGLAQKVYTVPIASSEAGCAPSDLADAAIAAGLSAKPAANVRDALAQIEAERGAGEPLRVLIGGSLYLAGDVLAQNGTPPC